MQLLPAMCMLRNRHAGGCQRQPGLIVAVLCAQVPRTAGQRPEVCAHRMADRCAQRPPALSSPPASMPVRSPSPATLKQAPRAGRALGAS